MDTRPLDMTDDPFEGLLGTRRGGPKPPATLTVTNPGIFGQGINAAGRQFTFRVVREGDRYGLNRQLVHAGDPVVEVFDATYRGRPAFDELGQFTGARAYLDGLRTGDGGWELHGGESAWTVSREAMDQVRDWLELH